MRSRLGGNVLRSALVFVSLVITMWTLRNPSAPFYDPGAGPVFETGHIPESTRLEILDQLRVFQEAYAARDVSRVDEFAGRLFSRDEIIVLGTAPREIHVGWEEATELVRSDWESWGDCTFRVEQAGLSVQGDVATLAMAGLVRFDLSRFLVMPLRLAGVMVREDGAWRFRQLQFQFDVDLSFLLLLALLLMGWLVMEILVLLAACWRALVAPGSRAG